MQAKRDEIAEKSDGAAEYAQKWLDCQRCPFSTPERAAFRCGWMARSEWKPGLRPFAEASCCPGYLTQQPEVYEAARALGWKRDGSLRDEYDQPLTPVLRDCIDILDSACREVEREALRKQRREMSRGTK